MSQAAKKNPPPSMVAPNFSSFEAVKLTQAVFESFAQKIYQMAGIHLPYNDKNIALLSNRLTRLIREHNFKNFEELNEKMRMPSEKLKQDFVSALTTNKTDFFREEAHFDFLKKQLPEMLKAKPEIRIWSSACSAGSEPYTVAIVAAEILNQLDRQRVKILATDIDLEILKKAVQAQYTPLEMEGLQPHHKQKYFKSVGKQLFEMIPEIAKSVHFSEFNLMNFQYRFQKKFDVVFCRNVLIYFDKETTDRVLDLLVSNLEVKGYLIIGHSESGVIKHPCLKSLGNSIFQKVRN